MKLFWKIFSTSLASVVLLTGHGQSGEMPDLQGIRVHHISGSREYESEESLQAWAAHLEKAYGVESTFSLAEDKGKTAPNLEALTEADVLVVFARRLELPEEQLQAVQQFVAQGKPVIGIRTASHAFQSWPEFDSEILGGDYSGHGPAEEGIAVEIAEDHAGHPILAGITPWTRDGKLYRNPNLTEDAAVLLRGVGQEETVPLAWVRERNAQRIFYTSLGFPHDFGNPQFIQLLDQALHWVVAGKEEP